MDQNRVNGVFSASLTPVDAQLNIDQQRLRQHVGWLLDNGCHGVALFGTTGEATSFSVNERKNALDALIADGVDPTRLLVGAGCCALSDSVELAKHALANGCNNVLMLPPFYYKGASDAALAASYAAVFDRVADASLKVILYHFPRLSGVPITEGLVALLVDQYPDTVVGIKDSGGDFDNTLAMINAFPGLNIFPGSERFIAQGLRLGGAGCITATGNINPVGARAVWDAWQAGGDDVDTLQAQCTAVREAIEAHSLVTIQKAWLAQQRSDPDWAQIRPPMEALPEASVQQLSQALTSLKFEMAG